MLYIARSMETKAFLGTSVSSVWLSNAWRTDRQTDSRQRNCPYVCLHMQAPPTQACCNCVCISTYYYPSVFNSAWSEHIITFSIILTVHDKINVFDASNRNLWWIMAGCIYSSNYLLISIYQIFIYTISIHGDMSFGLVTTRWLHNKIWNIRSRGIY